MSNIFSSNGTVVIGLQLGGMLGSSVVFLSGGSTQASLSLVGTAHELKEESINMVTKGASSLAAALIVDAGQESPSHLDGLSEVMIFSISRSETGVNLNWLVGLLCQGLPVMWLPVPLGHSDVVLFFGCICILEYSHCVTQGVLDISTPSFSFDARVISSVSGF